MARDRVPHALERWLEGDDAVVWLSRARPALLRWPPRSVWLLFLLASALAAVGISSLAWSQVTGVAAMASDFMPCLITIGAAWMGGLFLLGVLDPRGRYAVVRTREGRLIGYTFGRDGAIRFALPAGGCDPMALERGDVEWGEVEVEHLPDYRPVRMRVRWPDAAQAEQLAALLNAQSP